MKIILIEKIEKLGNIGDIIDVKNGYAKNYLLPKQKALLANYKNTHLYQQKILNKNLLNEKKLNLLNEKLSDVTIFMALPAKNDNSLYEQINNNKIIKLLKNFDINLKEKNLPESTYIKKIGTYKIKIENKNEFFIYLTIVKINK